MINKYVKNGINTRFLLIIWKDIKLAEKIMIDVNIINAESFNVNLNLISIEIARYIRNGTLMSHSIH
jgi:hypothetical protein